MGNEPTKQESSDKRCLPIKGEQLDANSVQTSKVEERKKDAQDPLYLWRY